MIGHMILNKMGKPDMGPSTGAAILGLKVVGGKVIEKSRLGAIVERVKKGSMADTVGQIKEGVFQNKT